MFSGIVVCGAYTRKGIITLTVARCCQWWRLLSIYSHVFAILSQIGRKCFEIITKSSVWNLVFNFARISTVFLITLLTTYILPFLIAINRWQSYFGLVNLCEKARETQDYRVVCSAVWRATAACDSHLVLSGSFVNRRVYVMPGQCSNPCVSGMVWTRGWVSFRALSRF